MKDNSSDTKEKVSVTEKKPDLVDKPEKSEEVQTKLSKLEAENKSLKEKVVACQETNKDLEKKNQALEKDVASYKDKLLRNVAELENFKRRTNEEKIKDRKYALSGILTKLIEVKDNFDRCLAVENSESIDAFKEGVLKIERQFDDILKNEGLEEIKAKGEKFNPKFHQAVMNDKLDELDNEEVIEEFQKGYMYKERVLRPSMVKVNKK